MASKFSYSKPNILSNFLRVILFSFSFAFVVLLLLSFDPRPILKTTLRIRKELEEQVWFDASERVFGGDRKIKVGLVNIKDGEMESTFKFLRLAKRETKTVSVGFDRVADGLKWENFFPPWIDEEQRWSPPSCPHMGMPRPENYRDLDVIVAKVPCGRGDGKGGTRDLYRLQVNLVVANLVARNVRAIDRPVHVVFVGSCEPMVEIFRCDDILMHEGEYRVYKPERRKLKEKVLMPFGSCKLAPHANQIGNREVKEAYVTVLHSSEAYVCGAIALAQSILRTNSTKDLLLLADSSISSSSLRALRLAGWKTKNVDRIKSPFSKKYSYNEWNYSKLRIWQQIEYDKLVFVDSDLLILRNIDSLFGLPQLSAARNNMFLFNSGIMVIEPSACMFERLLAKSLELESYNGGDQGFLNEVFTWWHRFPTKMNHLKVFDDDDRKHEIPENLYAIHYLGLKPWMCYRDYDCNWDTTEHRRFASDSANRQWWKVYDKMPTTLQKWCGLTKKMDDRIRKSREVARNASLGDEHWKIKVTDPRKLSYVD